MGTGRGAKPPSCVWLERAYDRALVGGKGASLGQLAMLGVAVPAACALTTEVYRAVSASLGLPRRTTGLGPDALRGIRETIERAPLPETVTGAIEQAFSGIASRIGAPPELAVRSSTPVEDGEAWSFAGLHDTVLGVRTRDGVERAARSCWASLWSERAVHYRALAGLDTDACAIAVVIQHLARCDVSFVMFTLDPVSGERGHVVIVASWGLGEAVVSGLVTPDHIVVGLDGGILRYEVGDKARMIIPGGPSMEGTRQVPVPRDLQREPALSGAQAADIAALGRSLEAALGYPADIEGGVVDGRVLIFQARPITGIFGASD